MRLSPLILIFLEELTLAHKQQVEFLRRSIKNGGAGVGVIGIRNLGLGFYQKNNDAEDSQSSNGYSNSWTKNEQYPSSNTYKNSDNSYRKWDNQWDDDFDEDSPRDSSLLFFWGFLLLTTTSAIGMLATAHQFETNPEGAVANFCRLSLHTIECIWKIVWNLYNCRLGDIPSVISATDTDPEEYTEEELERMKLRPGIERALEVEHRRALKKETPKSRSKSKNRPIQKQKIRGTIGPGLEKQANISNT